MNRLDQLEKPANVQALVDLAVERALNAGIVDKATALLEAEMRRRHDEVQAAKVAKAKETREKNQKRKREAASEAASAPAAPAGADPGASTALVVALGADI